MRPAYLEDFRFPVRVTTTTDHRWPTILAWQATRLVAIKPETKTTAMVELTAAGLHAANLERGMA